MKYDWRNDLFLFLLIVTIIATAFFCGGCALVVLRSDYDRVEDVALQSLKRNIKLLGRVDSLETEIEYCKKNKLFMTEVK